MKPRTKEGYEIITGYLGKMADFAIERQAFLDKHREGWKKGWYIRIGGNGFRSVSVEHETALKGFAKKSDTDINKIAKQFKSGCPEKLKPDIKPERRVQSWLIKTAINNSKNLKSVLRLDDSEVDELLFACDEVSFGDRKNKPINRCDILAVGIRDNKGFPVSIEIKYGHKRKEVLTQLRDYQEDMKNLKPSLKTLLKNCVNKEVDFSKYGKIIIWPEGKISHKTLEECIDKNVLIIQYSWDKSKPIETIKFKPYPGLKMAA
jgi:hypothetical protein